MRIFKNIIIGSLIIAILIFLFSLLFPRTVKVNRDILINAHADSIFKEIAGLERWVQWYAPLNDTTEVVINSLRSSGTQLEWLNKKGNQNRVSLVKKDTFFVETEFYSSNEKKMSGRFILHKTGNGHHTRVEWQMLVELGWLPWNKFSGIFAEKLIAPGQEMSLRNLKMILESVK